MKRNDLLPAVCAGMILGLTLPSSSALYVLPVMAEAVPEGGFDLESDSEYALDASEGFFTEMDDGSDEFAEDAASPPADPSGASAGQTDPSAGSSEKKASGDRDGLIEDPSGNDMEENIVFEVTDLKIREEIEREQAEEEENYTDTVYGRLYPPAPLLPGINSFRQGDMRWGTHPYGYANAAGTIPATISSSGCGLLSLVNAVYHMTGNFISPASLADWATTHGYRVNGIGTAHALYQAYAQAFGDVYGFTYAGTASDMQQIRSFLHEGGAAIISSDHHLMCVVDYDEKKGGYLLLDSAPSSYRGTSPTGYRYLSDRDFAESIPVYSIILLKSAAQRRKPKEVPGLENGLVPDMEFLNRVLTAVPIPSARALSAETASSSALFEDEAAALMPRPAGE